MSGSVEIDGKQAAAAVFRFLEQRGPQGRTRTHRTPIPGHLDFSTATARGCIAYSGAVLSRADIAEIVQRHHADNDKNKAIMVFTTAAPDVGKRTFAFHPIFHLASNGTITPWNRRARILTPRTAQQQARRRVVWWTILTLLVIALMVAAVMTVAGVASGPVRAVGITVVVVCALAIIGAVSAVLEATGVLTRLK